MASSSIICRSRMLRQIIDLRDTGKSCFFLWLEPSWIIVLSFDHQDCFHILITSRQLIREAICHFPPENVVPITHEQNIICSKTRLDGTTHEQTIICRQLFAGHVVDSRPIERNASNDNELYLYGHERELQHCKTILIKKKVNNIHLMYGPEGNS